MTTTTTNPVQATAKPTHTKNMANTNSSNNNNNNNNNNKTRKDVAKSTTTAGARNVATDKPAPPSKSSKSKTTNTNTQKSKDGIPINKSKTDGAATKTPASKQQQQQQQQQQAPTVPTVKNLTREEECCFKAALAMVVIQKRIAASKSPLDTPLHGKRLKTNHATATTPRVVTPSMQTLLFPSNNNNISSSNNNKSSMLPTCFPKNDQHVATMYATALRTAGILCGNDSDQQLWATVEGLASHLSHQLSIALRIIPTAPNSSSMDQVWVEDWMEHLVRQLWDANAADGAAAGTAAVATAEQATTNDTTDKILLQKISASFLLWDMILLEQSGASTGASVKLRSKEVARVFGKVLERFFQTALQGRLPLSPDDAVDDAVGTSRFMSLDSSVMTGPRRSSSINGTANLQGPTRDAIVVHALQLLQLLARTDTTSTAAAATTTTTTTTATLDTSVLMPWEAPPCQWMVPPANVTAWYGLQTDRVRRGGRTVTNNNLHYLDPGAQLMTMVALYQAYGETKEEAGVSMGEQI